MEQCIEIVETHGMENVGVYRVPGNFVVINALTESFNRGDFSQSDLRWNDVNAISFKLTVSPSPSRFLL